MHILFVHPSIQKSIGSLRNLFEKLLVCMCTGVKMPWYMFGVQRIPFGSPFLPSSHWSKGFSFCTCAAFFRLAGLQVISHLCLLVSHCGSAGIIDVYYCIWLFTRSGNLNSNCQMCMANSFTNWTISPATQRILYFLFNTEFIHVCCENSFIGET